DTESGNSWAIFSTRDTTNTLFARVNANGATQDVSLGALPMGFHAYMVRPVSGGFKFYIDGALKATISATLPAGTVLKAALCDFTGNANTPLQADWIRISSYTSGGTFASSVFDAGRIAQWGTTAWTATLPAGTSMLVETQSGNTPIPDASWSNWLVVNNGGTIGSPSARYLCYRVTLVTTNATLTP